MPALIVKDGPNAGQRYEIDDELTLGRENAGVTIEDAEMSRKHAVIRPRDGSLEIEDLGSLNGTFVNGSKIEAATTLSSGDTVKVGTTTLEVEGVAARSAETIAAPAARPAEPEASAPEAPPPPPPPPPPPAEPAPAPQSLREAPAEPFGHYSDAKVGGKGKIASRQLTPQLIAIAAIIATTIALVVYFAANPI